MKPGTKTIIAGVLIFLIGAFVLPALFVLRLAFNHGPENQFESPGTTEVSVLKPGRYFLWNDFQTFYKGKTFSRSERIPDGLEIRIHDNQGGELHLRDNASISERVGAELRKSIGYVDVERPGRLFIDISGNNEKRVFSFSRSHFRRAFAVIGISFGLAILAGIAGLVILIRGIATFSSAKKQASQGPITLGGVSG